MKRSYKKSKENNLNLKKMIFIFLCFSVLCFVIFDAPKFDVSTFDLFLYKLSNLFLFVPVIFIILIVGDFQFIRKVFFFKNNTFSYKVFCVFLVFIMSLFVHKSFSLLYSDDYIQKLNDFDNVSIKFNNATENVEDTEVEKSHSLPEEEIQVSESVSVNSNGSNNSETVEVKEEVIYDDNSNEVIGEKTPKDDVNISEDSLLVVHFIDVGQGDSIFIELPNSETMLIDAGTATNGKIVSDYISALNYTDIDYLVGTHPHADHIGGLSEVINNFDIGNIYMPKCISTSKTYENLLETILNNNLSVKTAKSGVSILNEKDLKIKILSPVKEYSDLNNCSAVIKIIYKNRSFLFMGDAEEPVEVDITEDVSADVIKVGHHGSDTSSSYEFVQRVNASYAIISVGEDNQYDHPYEFIIERWENSGARVYRTDLDGSIIVKSNGENLIVS